MKRLLLLLAACAAAGLLAAWPAGGAELSPELLWAQESLGADEELPVIVHFAEQAELKKFKVLDRRTRRARIVRALRARAEASQRAALALLRVRGARRVRELWAANALAATVKVGALGELARLPGVKRLRYDAAIPAPEVQPAAAGAVEWNVAAIRAPELWALGWRGQGVVVATMDTGVDAAHPDLAAAWRGGAGGWYDPNGQHATPYDADGHGTQAMGLLVGADWGGTAIGAAPEAKWIAAKIYNDQGYATLSNIHLSFQWALDPDGDPDTDDAPDVVSNSWGFSQHADECLAEFQEDVRALSAAGIAVVFPAGNEGPEPYTSVSPANYPESLAVGAIDEALVVAGFSGRGPSACGEAIYPHLVAPGVNVRTADLTFGGLLPDSYAYVSGTSFAAPQLAGAVALLLSANPGASCARIAQALKLAAADLGPPGPDNDYGWGLADVVAAHQALQEEEPPPPPPGPECPDADGDGFPCEEGCGGPADCDDTDASVYPGAPEVKHDGIDQDCNGHDLTIEVIKADYDARRRLLRVAATSGLNAAAALELAGFGPMRWDGRRRQWTISVRGVAADPGQVVVSGPEGSETSPTTLIGSRPQRLLRAAAQQRRELRARQRAALVRGR